jgi:hypothetical protein
MNEGVKKTSKAYDNHAIGIISTEPGMIIGNINADPESIPALVALAGRVPVKVSLENGPIEPGDNLTPSSEPGVAMKATKAGLIIGQALTAFHEGEAPYVVAFVKNSHGNGSKIAEVLPGLSVGVVPEGSEDDAPVLPEVLVPQTVGEQALAYFLATRQEGAEPIEMSEILADRVSAAIEIVSPRVLTDELETRTIASSAADGSISLMLSETGSFNVLGQTPTEGAEPVPAVITFDALGNAAFAGHLTAKSIEAESITGLEIFTDRIAVLSDAVDELNTSGEEVTGADIVNVRDLIAMVNNSAVANDQSLLVTINDNAAAQLLVNEIFLAGLTALELRVTGLETGVLAHTGNLEDLTTRLTALEAQSTLDLAGLTLNGDLNVSGLVTFSGGLFVDTIGSNTSMLTLLGDLMVIGRPYFNEDTGGFALVRSGATEVRVDFTEAYLAQPIVQASVTFEALDTTIGDETLRQSLQADLAAAEAAYLAGDIRYVITEKSTTGFTIVLSQPAVTDLRFSWIALAVEGAGLDESELEEVIEPAIEPEPVVNTGSEEGTGGEVVDPFDATTPDNLNPDFAPLEDNVPSEVVPEIVPEPVVEEPVTTPEVVPTEPEIVAPVSEEPTPAVEPVSEPAVDPVAVQS